MDLTSLRQQSNQAPSTRLSRHAQRRMSHRGIKMEAVEAALDYGRVIYTRGAIIYAIGKKEIAAMAESGIDLSAYDGIQVVCSLCGEILTTYRNRKFHRLRPNLCRGRYNRTARCPKD